MNVHIIYMTCQDKAQARDIGRELVESRLVACVNIFDQMNSMYFWEGNFQDDQEAVLIAKTAEDKVSAVIEVVKARHTYENPCIVDWPLAGGNIDFMGWVIAQTR
jgi:periplasmic divalent cation tolerance protein